MKKLLLIFVILCSINAISQKKYEFGVSAGLFHGMAGVKVNGADIKNTLPVSQGTAFYFGVSSHVALAEKFKLQPELLYVFSGKRGAILLPVLVKYYPIEKLNVLLGPQLDMFINMPSNVKPYLNNLGLGIAVGGGYDITTKLSVQVKYSLGITQRFNKSTKIFIEDSISDLLPNVTVDPSFKANSFQVGVIYKI